MVLPAQCRKDKRLDQRIQFILGKFYHFASKRGVQRNSPLLGEVSGFSYILWGAVT
jgi:hypothetical protein